MQKKLVNKLIMNHEYCHAILTTKQNIDDVKRTQKAILEIISDRHDKLTYFRQIKVEEHVVDFKYPAE